MKFGIRCVGIVKCPLRQIIHSLNSDSFSHIKVTNGIGLQTSSVVTKTQFVDGCWYCLTVRFIVFFRLTELHDEVRLSGAKRPEVG